MPTVMSTALPTITLNQDVEKFYNYLQSERRYSSNTVSAYQRDIKKLIQHCELEKDKAINWDEITQSDIRQCVATFAP